MIDTDDTQTQDLFPVEPNRGRGRPSTGQAKTSAQRQHEYRLRKHRGADGGQVTINHWVSLSNKLALERLAAHYRCSESDVLNRLISAADKSITDRFEYGSDQWNEYFNIRNM